MSRWKDWAKQANACAMSDFYDRLDAEIDKQEKEEPEYWSEIERQKWAPIDNDQEWIDNNG